MQDTEELKAKIEKARLKLNASIQSRENLQEAYENSVEAVSYTHLDVYKRQALQPGADYYQNDAEKPGPAIQQYVEMCIRDRFMPESRANHNDS